MIGIRVSYKLIKDTPVAEDCKHLFARGYEEHEKLRKSTASFLIDKFRENAKAAGYKDYDSKPLECRYNHLKCAFEIYELVPYIYDDEKNEVQP